jgi:alanine racemase
MMPVGRPAWVEVDLTALAHNMREIRRVTSPSAQVMAVVKANGYGHGMVAAAMIALRHGASRLAVAIVDEAFRLRQAGFAVPIHVLGYTPANQLDTALKAGAALTVWDLDTARAYSEAARGAGGRRLPVHLKVDTGMGRIGIADDAGGVETALAIGRLPGLHVEGVFTHFAAADEADKSYTLRQLERFLNFDRTLRRAGLEIPIRHTANSAAILDIPEAHLDLVRPGIVYYGYRPSPDTGLPFTPQPALSLKARLSHVKEVPSGTPIGYGRAMVTSRASVIATLPLGYADGYFRRLTGKASALVRGRRVPVAGRVCMDQTMLDVTGVPGVRMGDEVVLYGTQAQESVTVPEIAALAGTIEHEVCCALGARLPRWYRTEGGQFVSEEELFRSLTNR